MKRTGRLISSEKSPRRSETWEQTEAGTLDSTLTGSGPPLKDEVRWEFEEECLESESAWKGPVAPHLTFLNLPLIQLKCDMIRRGQRPPQRDSRDGHLARSAVRRKCPSAFTVFLAHPPPVAGGGPAHVPRRSGAARFGRPPETPWPGWARRERSKF
ncbi:hypothetical protein SKAU_G00085640 [Synaphobranchus kaupii]|uniref:Uncharacterized protein n=1 Tax=Synaphobranchus kaupii TaxID=118154 RepID=A0A9Q1J5Y5_SYNKA|nr:hypothetical protein SKAU_G00085640 [Synaphobranchus kaupii]